MFFFSIKLEQGQIKVLEISGVVSSLGLLVTKAVCMWGSVRPKPQCNPPPATLENLAF